MKTKILMAPILFFGVLGCNNPGSLELKNSMQNTEIASSLATGLTVIFDVPATISGAGSNGKISVDNSENLKSISILIDGKDMGRISFMPYQFFLNPNKFDKNEIVIEVEAVDMVDVKRKFTKTVALDKISTGSAGCMDNPDFDSCIFRKNPIHQNAGPLSGGVFYGKDLSAQQIYGVKITGLTNPNRLANNHISVSASGGQLATPINNLWKLAYQLDSSGKYNAQVMAYYWLNFQIDTMIEKGGIFYAANRNIQVDAFSTSVKNNAYWGNNRIVMGYWQSSTGKSQEMALSAEVYLHEMGHGNLDHAMVESSGFSDYCPSAQGCLSAIHEGQADIHAAIIFPEDPTMAQSITNTLSGWSDRDPRKNLALTMNQIFAWSNGEVHDMGAGYASILWKIYLDPSMTHDEFVRIFTLHLPRLTSDSDFRDCKTILMNLSDTYFQGKYTTMIKNAFESKGVL